MSVSFRVIDLVLGHERDDFDDARGVEGYGVQFFWGHLDVLALLELIALDDVGGFVGERAHSYAPPACAVNQRKI
jgi:hypothetical protein